MDQIVMGNTKQHTNKQRKSVAINQTQLESQRGKAANKKRKMKSKSRGITEVRKAGRMKDEMEEKQKVEKNEMMKR